MREITRAANGRLPGDKSGEGEVGRKKEKKNTLTIMSDIKISEMGPLEPGPAQTPWWERTDWHVTEVVSKSWFVFRGIFCKRANRKSSRLQQRGAKISPLQKSQKFCALYQMRGRTLGRWVRGAVPWCCREFRYATILESHSDSGLILWRKKHSRWTVF